MTKVAQDHRRASRFVRPAMLGACAALLAVLSGCGMEVANIADPDFSGSSRGNPGKLIEARRAEFKVDHDVYASLGYRLDWRGFPVVQRGQHVTYFDAYDDIVVVQESGATLSVLEASNGALRNSAQVASPLTRFVGNFRTGNYMVVTSDNEVIVVDVQTGDIIDRQPLDRVISTGPVFVGGQKIYGTSIGHVYSHYLNPPVDAWAFDMGSPIDTELVQVGQIVVAVARSGRIAFLDGPSGTLVGQGKIFAGCEADPVAGEGLVYLASLDQSVYCYSLDGHQQWRLRTEQPLRVTPTYHAGVLYAVTGDKGLRALDANTGAQLWNNPGVMGRVVAVRGGRLITWDGAKAASLDAATGDVIRQAELPAVDRLVPDAFVDGNLYAISTGGIVAKFQPRD